MTSDQILQRISNLSGKTTNDLLLFCRNNSISYSNLNTFYTKFSRLPTIPECGKIRQFGDTFINSL